MRRLYLADREDAPDHRTVRFEQGKPYVEVPEAEARKLASQVPDNAISISSPQEAPFGAQVIQGPRGGWWYVPKATDPAQQELPVQEQPSEEGDLPTWQARMEDMLADRAAIAEQAPEGAPIEAVQAKLDEWFTIPFPPDAERGEEFPLDVDEFVNRIGEFVVLENSQGEETLGIVYNIEGFGPDVQARIFDVDSGGFIYIYIEDYKGKVFDGPPGLKDKDAWDVLSDVQASRRALEITDALNRYETRTNDTVPESLDARRAEEIRTLGDMGVVGGINADSTTIAVMPDGSKVFMKDYSDATLGDGEVAFHAHDVIDQMGADAPLAFYDDDAEIFIAQGVTDGRTLNKSDMFGPDWYWREPTQAVVAGMLVGNGDMHGGNLMSDRHGRVWLIDNDLSGKTVWDAETGEMKKEWVDHLAQLLRSYNGAGTAEIVNDMASKMANRLDRDELRLQWEYADAKNNGALAQMYANLLWAQTKPLIPPDMEERFNKRVRSPEEWAEDRAQKWGQQYA